jgi:hypothetical protein
MDLKAGGIDSGREAHWARRLSRGNALLLGALAAHTVEHLVRQPSGPGRPPARLWAAAGLLYAIVGRAWVLARQGDPRAAIGSVTSGFATSAGPLLAHAVPRWGPFSLPYGEGDADALSWALLFGVAAAGVGVGIAGVQASRELGTRGTSQPVAKERRAEEARAYA